MFKAIVWDTDGPTIPATGGETARHVMSILAAELSWLDEGKASPTGEDVERAVKWLLSLDGLEKRAQSWFDECCAKHPSEFLPPPGHPESFDQRNMLRAIGIGQKDGALEALIHHHRVVDDVYACFCELTDGEIPDELQGIGTPSLLSALGMYFLDRSIGGNPFFRETHLVQACECLTLAALNRVGDGVASAHTEHRRYAALLRWKKDPAQAAKTAARDLWPDANRHGWTAAQFHRALSDGKHAVAFDTARKWLTALRKTGTC